VGCRARGAAAAGSGSGESRDRAGRKTPREGWACGGGGQKGIYLQYPNRRHY